MIIESFVVTNCVWNTSSDLKILFGVSSIFIGIIGGVLNGWLISSFVLRIKVATWTHLLLLQPVVSALTRMFLAGVPFSASSAFNGGWLFGDSCCQLYAFLRHFCDSLQVNSIAFLALERYLISVWPFVGKKLYLVGISGCWMVSLLLASLPLFGVGRYGCDFIGVACSLDWFSKTDLQYKYNIVSFFLIYIAPIFIVAGSLWRAFSHSGSVMFMGHFDEISFNKTAAALSAGTLLLWSPQILLVATALFQLGVVPDYLTIIAPVSMELSSLMPLIAFLLYEPRLRASLLGSPQHLLMSSSVARNRCYNRGIRLIPIPRAVEIR
nr:PREDICTED: visual pigment-like receptor peropsin [Bemisia tabaci]